MVEPRLKVGLMLPQTEGLRQRGMARWAEINALARLAEDVGFDSLWVVDHFLYQLLGEDRGRGVWECWSLLSALAATTHKVELGTLVIGTGFRNPALLAKMADTVDEISDGRLILGLGAGYHEREYQAFGYPFDHRVSRFAEAIAIVHGLLRRGEIDFAGNYYQARDCELRPRGPRSSGPPILVGSSGPRMLGLVARYADCWNAYYDDTRNSVESIPRLREAVDAACRAVGREPSTLMRTATVLAADEADAEASWNRLPTQYGKLALKPLSGPPELMAAELDRYASEGIGHIQMCIDPTTPETIEAFARVLESLRRIEGDRR
jgi:alkanesulfonate monooxygenase SsuD/methylene tetrahydromethanopterin reductase-like flavin-dependent oxidoreductase (luciferase family)